MCPIKKKMSFRLHCVAHIAVRVFLVEKHDSRKITANTENNFSVNNA